MRGHSPAPSRWMETAEKAAARCGLNPLLRLDRARSIHTLAAEHGHQESLPPE